MFNTLINADSLEYLKTLEEKSIDAIVTDPPYFLSNGGLSYSNGKIVSVNKGDWDKVANREEARQFTWYWLTDAKRIIKDNGSIWISGTHHNIFDVGYILNELNFKIINIVVWKKLDPPPLIYKNKFRFSAEFLIWAKLGRYHKFNYKEMYKIYNKEMQDVWFLDSVRKSEKKYGKHPTQKPIELLKRIILSCTNEGDLVLDPFMGSGTTCVAAKLLGRNFVGIEENIKYYEIATNRINTINEKD